MEHRNRVLSILAWGVVLGVLFSVGIAFSQQCPPPQDEKAELAPITSAQLDEILHNGGTSLVFQPEENYTVQIFLTQVSRLLVIRDVPLKEGGTLTIRGVFVLAQKQVNSDPLGEPMCIFAATPVQPGDGSQDKETPPPPRFDRRERIPEIEELYEITNLFGSPTPLGVGLFV